MRAQLTQSVINNINRLLNNENESYTNWLGLQAGQLSSRPNGENILRSQVTS
jgi:hypothetical protein